ncbi:MAG TPA: glycosyl transferase family 1, partial [Bacteroidales bacterium]|nr:glycosyl transferase family 1 [Bacteroidales bacterium]
KIVLFFGFIRDYKGLDLLIKAFAHKKIRQLGIKLLVAGEFYENAEIYHSLAEELGVLDSIIWHTEFIPNAKVREYFCAANLVAQPYRSATQSGVTQVAYHFEKPMLVTKVGGLPEMVPHLKAGYVVAPVVLEIVDAIVHFFEEEKGDEFKAFLQNEKKRFSWQVLVQALLNPTKN